MNAIKTWKYQVQVNGGWVYNSNRIDHATKRYEREVAEAKTEVVRLMRGGEVIKIHEPKAEPKKRTKPSNGMVTKLNKATAKTKKERAEKKQSTRTRHNGDIVARALAKLDGLDAIADLTRKLADRCLANGAGNPGEFLSTDMRREHEFAMIESARTRENRGSGRMSMGLMIRKYAKYLGLTEMGEILAD